MDADTRTARETALIDPQTPGAVAVLAFTVAKAIAAGRDVGLRVDSHGWLVATRVGAESWYAMPMSDAAAIIEREDQLRKRLSA